MNFNLLRKKKKKASRLFFEKLTNTFCPRSPTLRFQEHLLRSVSFNLSRIFFSCLIISWNYRNTETKGMKCLLFCFLEMGTASSDSEKSLKTLAFTSVSTFICCWRMGDLATQRALLRWCRKCGPCSLLELENHYTSNLNQCVVFL